MNLNEIRARLAAIADERRAIHTEAGDAALNDEQSVRWDALDTEEAELRAAEATAVEQEERAARVAESRSRWGSVNVNTPRDPFAALAGGASRTALVDAIVRANAERIEDRDNATHFERLVKRHAGDVAWAQNILARSRPEYESGWAKLMMGRGELLTSEERAALVSSTNTQGGYLVPTHLDPTLMITNAGSSNAIRRLSRVVTLTGGANEWNGVTTAGVTASWDAELAEVSDDTPGVGTVTIPVHKGQAFVQASIEAFEDIAGLAGDVLMLFADAKDRLEGAAHATGTGSGQPKGIVTAIDASASLEVVSTTAATIGEVDVHALYRALPIRWRGRGTFVMNPVYSLAIKRLGAAVGSAFSGYLTEPTADRLIGRPVVESDDMPTTQNTTELNPEIVYGDFSNYVIVDKPGSTSVEFIPHLFNTANNLPDGRRGWLMYFRSGADAANLAAFRLLMDKTSA